MKKGKILVSLTALLLTLSLSSCFDVGNYGGEPGQYSEALDEEYYQSYYDSYGSIDLCTQTKSLNEYSLRYSFFSKSTINNLTWEDSEYAVPFNEYLYMGIEVKKDMTLDELALYIKGDENVVGQTLKIYLYIKDTDVFTPLPNYNSLLYQVDDDGKPLYDEFNKLKMVNFGLPDKESAVAEATVKVNKGVFESFTIKSFNNFVDDKIHVEEGQYIILSFYNNTAYGKALNYEKISFTALNLIIKADID